MIPVNGNTSPCSPISSNCVVWQGPNLDCIDLCTGDTVSDVIARLAKEICDLAEAACCEPDLTGLDLKCIQPEATPETLTQTIQAIVDHICANDPRTGGTTPDLPVPACLQYNDPLGDLVIQLPLIEWATLIGNKICDNIASISLLNQNILNLETRVDILEACVLPCTPSGSSDPDILSSCLFVDGQGQGTLVPTSTLLSGLEQDFCSYRSVVGTVQQINSAISAQCITGTTSVLSGTAGNYGSIPGWQSNASTLAQINQNQWIAICDMHTAITNIQDNCCNTASCDGFDLFINPQVNTDPNGTVLSIDVSLVGSQLPANFVDNGSSYVVTDGVNQINSNFNFVNAFLNNATFNIAPLGTLDVSGVPLTITVTARVEASDGSSNCQVIKTAVTASNVYCPTNFSVTAAAGGNAVIGFNHTASSPNFNYEILLINMQTSSIVSTQTYTPTLGANSITIGGLTAGLPYKIQLKASATGSAPYSDCDEKEIQGQGVLCNDLSENIASYNQQAGSGNLIYAGGVISESGGNQNNRLFIRSSDDGNGNPTFVGTDIYQEVTSNWNASATADNVFPLVLPLNPTAPMSQVSFNDSTGSGKWKKINAVGISSLYKVANGSYFDIKPNMQVKASVSENGRVWQNPSLISDDANSPNSVSGMLSKKITHSSGTTDDTNYSEITALGVNMESTYLKLEIVNEFPSDPNFYLYSTPIILRYDYSTKVVTVLTDQQGRQNIDTNSALGSAFYDVASITPAGQLVSKSVLTSNGQDYLGSTTDSYWFYLGEYEVQGVNKYLYALWERNPNTAATTQKYVIKRILVSCECPSFLLIDDLNLLACTESGSSLRFSVPYILGQGGPVISIANQPAFGQLIKTQTANPSEPGNEFVYTSGGTDTFGVTFDLEVSPAGSAACYNPSYGNTYTIQLQLQHPNTNLTCQDVPVLVFIDTGSFNDNLYSSLTDFQDEMEILIARLKAECSNPPSGSDSINPANWYVLPTTSSRYLRYHRAIRDQGVSYTPDASWSSITVAPSNWNTSAGTQGPNLSDIIDFAAIIVLTGNATQGAYHADTLASGFNGPANDSQPTAKYKEDYETLHDVCAGTINSQWANDLVNGGFAQGQLSYTGRIVHHVVSLANYDSATNPNVGGAGASKDQAFILHGLAAYAGDMISSANYGVPTSTDVTGYLLTGVATGANPYFGAATSAGTAIEGLYKDMSGNGRVVYHLNQYLAQTRSAVNTENPIVTRLRNALGFTTCGFPATPCGA
jgi:hypothetical protein